MSPRSRAPQAVERSADEVWCVPTDVAGHVEQARRLLSATAEDQR